MRPQPPTRTARAKALLQGQRARLAGVIATTAFPEVRSLAERYLAKADWYLAQPEGAIALALGPMGPNGYGPAIDDVCRQAEFHARRDRPQTRAA